MTVKIAIAGLWSLALLAAAGAEPSEQLLTEIKPFGLQFVLKVPPLGKVVPIPTPSAHPQQPTISVKTADGDIGLIVQARSGSGKVLWSHDFGYNASDSNEVSVETSPLLSAVIVHYHGYKWDHSHVLLLVTPKKEAGDEVEVTEYKTAEKDLMPALEKHSQFQKGFEYFIYPLSFKENLVVFECIPLAKNESAAHPFEQNPELWFTIEAKLASDQSIKPLRVIPSRDGSK